MVDDTTWDDEIEGVRSADNLRRMWKPQREVKVDGFEARVAWSTAPVPVVISRWLEPDERREVVIRAHVGDEGGPQIEAVYVYAHALETERGVVRLVRVLEGPGWCGSRDGAWGIVPACEGALHVAREAWLEAHERDHREAKALIDQRHQRFAELAAASSTPRELGSGRKGAK